jgi:hypothetical protein
LNDTQAIETIKTLLGLVLVLLPCGLFVALLFRRKPVHAALALLLCMLFVAVGIVTIVESLKFREMTPSQHLAAANAAINIRDWNGAFQHLDVIKAQFSATREWQVLFTKAREGLVAQRLQEEYALHLARRQAQKPAQQISSALLPLPYVMRSGAGVLGYESDFSVATLRRSTNGITCIATPPGENIFDVRCYKESFLPVVLRMRELYAQSKDQGDVYRTVEAEIKAGKLLLPDHPTVGYLMVGPMSGYDAGTHTVSKEIKSWEAIHYPYKTAAQIGLPEEGAVARNMPYVVASGTFWCHVMIQHDDPESSPGVKAFAHTSEPR